MKKLIYLSLIILAACAPSEKAIQTAVAETLTAAPTATASPTATPQPTFTPSATATLAPLSTDTSDANSAPGQPGWVDYTMDDFSISLPDGWQTADISKEGMAGVLKLVKGLDTPLTEELLETLLSGEMASMGMEGSIKFFARDSENAMTAVINQSMPFSMGSGMLCMFLPAIFEQAGLEVVDSQCGLEQNGMQGGMFETRVRLRETPYRQQLYFFLDGSEAWILLSGVEETDWEKYKPVFTDIAESFEVGTASP